MSLATTLQRLREVKRLTQRTLASRSGLAISYLSRLENGRLQPTLKTLRRLAQGLGVPISELFDASDAAAAAHEHRCPVSSTGQCIGELIRSRRGRRPSGEFMYGPEELHILRLADFIVLHAPAHVRVAFRVVCESLVGEQGPKASSVPVPPAMPSTSGGAPPAPASS
jgi:transcriptional regulator with XRE-family HTH domain